MSADPRRSPSRRWWTVGTVALVAVWGSVAPGVGPVGAHPRPATTPATDPGPDSPAGSASGRAVGQDGRPVAAVGIELFEALPSGTRGRSQGTTSSDDDGHWSLPAGDGCHHVVATAPAGRAFVGGATVQRRSLCLDGGRTDRDLTLTLTSTRGELDGTVATPSGRPVVTASVDLYQVDGKGTGSAGADVDGGRYLGTGASDGQGRFRLPLPRPGCYRIGIAGAPPDAGRWCLDDRGGVTGPVAGPPDGDRQDPAITLASDRGHVSGRFVAGDGSAVPGGRALARPMLADGSPGPPGPETMAGAGGWFHLVLPAGCWWLELTPPEGARITLPDDPTAPESGPDHTACVADGASVLLDDTSVTGAPPGGPALSAVEWELLRLTNEWRADPAGPLARETDLPACVDDEYFEIELDPVTGRPVPVPPLQLDLAVVTAISRPWADRMADGHDLRHRDPDQQHRSLLELGLDVDSWGENIAWAENPAWADAADPTRVALVHVSGWRDSDKAHYCALITGRFTHVAVGQRWQGGQSWAAQNFYRPG